MNVTRIAAFPWRNGVSCSESRRQPTDAFHEGPGLLGLRESRGRDVAHLPDANLAYCLLSNHWHWVLWPECDGDLPAFMQQMTNMHVKRWKEHRHEVGYGHLYQGRYKCFPVETESYFYQGKEKVASTKYRQDICVQASLDLTSGGGVGRRHECHTHRGISPAEWCIMF